MTTAYVNAEQLLERIMAIDLDGRRTGGWSHVALFKEYLRRMALWATALDRTEDWLFFDVAETINSSIEADGHLMNQLNVYLNNTDNLGLMKDVYRWALHWAFIANTPEADRFSLPDPYEPLIVLYERGGFFRQQKDYWVVSESFGVSGVDLAKYDRTKPFVDLDPALLDILDAPENSI